MAWRQGASRIQKGKRDVQLPHPLRMSSPANFSAEIFQTLVFLAGRRIPRNPAPEGRDFDQSPGKAMRGGEADLARLGVRQGRTLCGVAGPALSKDWVALLV